MENFGIHGSNVKFGMTDEQVEILRKQIAVYAYISELLIDKHKHSSSRQHLTNDVGVRMFCDSKLIDKLSFRQRWKATTPQIQALEQIYAANPRRPPNKEIIKKITIDLSKYGKITESNVYNWFQNRRARTKKYSSVDAKSKVETTIDSKGKMIEPDELAALPNENLGHQNTQVGSDFLPYFNPEIDDSFAIF
ncbi:WUSCHEL-related homeobox 13-like [Vicia villosa]|uniref:WUSCHEL-related homeobox 13-like n=1 Tax=Vicia villosa TaxID=3911 RepID=UPI00273CB164|nr:WUSCHEL-related homeobox 13-like [Vicia villosa]